MAINLTLSALALILLTAAQAGAEDVTYTFAGLTAGPLTKSQTSGDASNQDGWYGDSAAPSAVFMVTSTDAFASKEAIAAKDVSQAAFAFKPFSRPFFAEGILGADIEVDFTVGFNASNLSLALTGDGTPQSLNNNIGPTKFSPALAFTVLGSSGIIVRLAPLTANGYGKEITETVPTETGGVYALKLSIDFTANGGDGAGTVYLKDLSHVGGTWTVTTIKDVNLGLTHSAPGFTWRQWNQLHLISFSANALPFSTIGGFSITAHKVSGQSGLP